MQLISLLLLGICLACHYLAFRRPARTSLGRALQRAGKVRLLGVAILLPISLFLGLNSQYPLAALLANQCILYLLGSSFIEMGWVFRLSRQRHTPDIRSRLRLGWAIALILQAGGSNSAYRDLAQATLATGLVWLILWNICKKLFQATPRSQWLLKLRDQLHNYGLLITVGLSGYYLLRAWTVVPLHSGQLNTYETALKLLVALAGVETAAVSLEFLLRSRQRSAEVSLLAADAVRAVLYCGLAASLLALARDQDFSVLALSSAFFSVGLGFALKPSLGNFVAGLVMNSTRDISIGDFISVDARFGKVLGIDWRSLTLGTNTLDAVSIPHRQVAQSLITNFSRPTPQHACYLEVRLSGEAAPGWVRHHLLEILAHIPEVASQPQPEIYLMNLSANSCTYRIRWWLHHICDRPPHESVVRRQLIYGLERSNLRPLHRHYEVITLSLPDTRPELDK